METATIEVGDGPIEVAGLPVALSVPDAGELLGMSRSAAYRAAKREDIPTIRLAGRIYVPTAELLDLVGLTLAEESDES